MEVLIAMFILTVGLMAMASLIAQSLSGTDNARYLGLATTLVSEKLEDLNRWPAVDPHVAAGGFDVARDSNNDWRHRGFNAFRGHNACRKILADRVPPRP